MLPVILDLIADKRGNTYVASLHIGGYEAWSFNEDNEDSGGVNIWLNKLPSRSIAVPLPTMVFPNNVHELVAFLAFKEERLSPARVKISHLDLGRSKTISSYGMNHDLFAVLTHFTDITDQIKG